MRTAAILIVGDEILSGEVTDENGPFLLRTLSDAGVEVVRVVTVPDRREEIASELGRLRAMADAVVVSGGIGPTHDDVTRSAVAETLGVDMEVDADAERRVRGFYADRATEAELAMARLPRGAELLDGEKTGTFGFRVGGVFALPGVPFLFRDIARRLPATFATRPPYRGMLQTRRREGEIAPRLAALQGRSLDVAIGSYPVYEDGHWHVRVVVRAGDRTRLEAVVAEVRAVLE